MVIVTLIRRSLYLRFSYLEVTRNVSDISLVIGLL